MKIYDVRFFNWIIIKLGNQYAILSSSGTLENVHKGRFKKKKITNGFSITLEINLNPLPQTDKPGSPRLSRWLVAPLRTNSLPAVTQPSFYFET